MMAKDLMLALSPVNDIWFDIVDLMNPTKMMLFAYELTAARILLIPNQIETKHPSV